VRQIKDAKRRDKLKRKKIKLPEVIEEIRTTVGTYHKTEFSPVTVAKVAKAMVDDSVMANLLSQQNAQDRLRAILAYMAGKAYLYRELEQQRTQAAVKEAILRIEEQMEEEAISLFLFN
jgi:IS30 family transposase